LLDTVLDLGLSICFVDTKFTSKIILIVLFKVYMEVSDSSYQRIPLQKKKKALRISVGAS
jgi:hypothetical protein